jgi:hypothetical protein
LVIVGWRFLVLSDEQLIERVRSELRAELADLRPGPDVLDGLWDEARDGASDRRNARPGDARRGWMSLGNLASVTAALVTLAVAAAAIVLVRHRAPQTPPIPTTDAVSHAGSSIALAVGAPAGPSQVSATSFQGAAIPSTVRLVAETPDPHGGLPWGLRTFQTTRGQTCLQVGRVQHGTIGVVGQDGAWANDHRFHPISPNAYTGDSCTQTDADGHAFNNVAEDGGVAIASANVPWGSGRQGGGCGASSGGRQQSPCPREDLRDLNYGLLGPHAASIIFIGPGGRRYTEPTNGPDGAYLIVSAPATSGQTCVLEPGRGRSCSSGGRTTGPELQSGVITQITYRNGSTCHLPAPTPAGVRQASCPPIGYTPPTRPRITSAQVATPVSARALPAGRYCSSGPLALGACRHGQTPLQGQNGAQLLEISFTARVPVTSANSYYEFADEYPTGAGCAGSSSSGPTLKNIKAGERVVFQDQIARHCIGTVHGTVAFVPDAGAAGFGSGPSPQPGHDGSLLVGTFILTIK